MPAICESISSKISENLSSSFKKNDGKENIENLLSNPTAKQVLSTKIDYDPVESYSSTILTGLQTKYIVLKPNQPNEYSNGSSSKTHQNIINGKNHQSNGTSTSPTQLPQPKKVLFPRENVQIGWRMNLHYSGVRWGHGCGFNNIGNTCYLNSALQAFLHVPAIAQWLISDTDHRNKCECGSSTYTCIICAMAKTLISTQRDYSITPSLITNRLHSICKHLTLGRQEDAHEFLRYLIEQMEKAYLNRFKNTPGFKDMDQYSKETTPLNQILGGYLRSTVACLSCKHDSITFQHFEDLQLDISRVSTLDEALSGYFARENLEDMGYKCESCKKRVSATKKFSLERAPVVLCIQLKRFNVGGGKLSKQIQIGEHLSLQKFISRDGDQSQSCKYRLVSMVTHLGGSASGGHYTAIGLAPNQNYYHFDDSSVRQASVESALRTNGYVLFFELTSIVKHQNGTNTNGQSVVHQNGHTYSKNQIPSTSSPVTSNFDRLRQTDTSFAKPNLPKMLPMSILRQQTNIKQKENETTPPSKTVNGPSSSKSPIVSNNIAKVSTQLFPATKTNGKREASPDIDDDADKEEVAAKRLKPTMPSVPRLLDDDVDDVKPQKSTQILNHSTGLANNNSSIKSKSLVPYDDESDDDQTSTSNGKKLSDEADEERKRNINFCRTSSGVFVETDLKTNTSPSKKGSTLENTKVIDTKASLVNGSATTNGQVNGNKSLTNGNASYVNRADDTFMQLKKLNHSGYGTSEVKSWSDAPTNMNREVSRDQQEVKKRQYEDDNETEMDRGRSKKIKTHREGYRSNSGPLPNPFQDQQNNINGSNRHHPHSIFNGNKERSMNGGSNYNRDKSNGNCKGYKNGYRWNTNGHRPYNQHYSNNNNSNNYRSNNKHQYRYNK